MYLVPSVIYVLNTFWRSCPNLVETIMSMFDTCNMSLHVRSIRSWPAGTARIAHEICVDVTAIDKCSPKQTKLDECELKEKP